MSQTTPKSTIEEPIPGNQHTFSTCGSASSTTHMTEQPPALENATTNRKQLNKHSAISHREDTTVSTYNVCSLKSAGRLHQLIHGCDESNIDIVAVQEHRRQTTEKVDTHIENYNGSDWRFDYCSATPGWRWHSHQQQTIEATYIN